MFFIFVFEKRRARQKVLRFTVSLPQMYTMTVTRLGPNWEPETQARSPMQGEAEKFKRMHSDRRRGILLAEPEAGPT